MIDVNCRAIKRLRRASGTQANRRSVTGQRSNRTERRSGSELLKAFHAIPRRGNGMDKIRVSGFVQRSLEHELNTRNEILIGIGFFRGGSCISLTTTVRNPQHRGWGWASRCPELRPLRVPISALEFGGERGLEPPTPWFFR
jgi:hypothetical protein